MRILFIFRMMNLLASMDLTDEILKQLVRVSAASFDHYVGGKRKSFKEAESLSEQ